MKSENVTIGHNKPPKSLEEMINDQKRVKIAPDVLKLLKPIPDPSFINTRLKVLMKIKLKQQKKKILKLET